MQCRAVPCNVVPNCAENFPNLPKVAETCYFVPFPSETVQNFPKAENEFGGCISFANGF
jgi:hypothetical protein